MIPAHGLIGSEAERSDVHLPFLVGVAMWPMFIALSDQL